MSRDQALLQAFASELKAQRSALKLSQEEFAHRADVNRTYIAKLELAQNQPTLCVMHQLAVALNSELPDLIQAVMLRYRRNSPKFGNLQKGWSAPVDCKPETDEQHVSPSMSNDLTHERPINSELKQTDSKAVSVRNRKVAVAVDFMCSSRYLTPRLTEFAVVEIVDGKITGSTFHAYFDPGNEIDSQYICKYKPPPDLLAGKPKFAEVVNNILAFINGSEILIHTIDPFINFLNIVLVDVGLAPFNESHPKIVSIFTLARKLLKIKSPSLARLCTEFEIEPIKFGLVQSTLWEARLVAEFYVRMCPMSQPSVSETSEQGSS